jgi:hypothetical protein
MVPPGATISSHSTKVAGTPTASIAVSTPRAEVIFVIASAALPAPASTSVAASLRAGIDRDFC